MPYFKRGFDLEDRICSALEAYGCTIQKDLILDHQHKIDFVVIRFPDNPAFYAMGVQVTANLDAIDKQQSFIEANAGARVTPRSVYLELSENVDLEAGGCRLILTVLMQFQFDKAYANERIVGVRIHDDLTYQFYDLTGRVKQLREREEQRRKAQEAAVESARPRTPLVSTAAAPGLMEGTLYAYLPHKRFGFIQTDGRGTFYIYIESIVDPALRAELESLPPTGFPAHVEIAVTFTDAGRTRPDAKYPEAKNVRKRA
jgi:hypothetical protein